MPNTPFTFTVSNLNKLINGYIANIDNLQDIYVVGEISNLTKHYSGHWYFSLKDDKAIIRCVMFKHYNQYVYFSVKDGDQVLIKANVTYYEGNGSLQLNIKSMSPYGQGMLLAKLNELKKKCYDLGYFDDSHKLPLPKFPSTIGLISGKDSAASADLHITLQRRWPIANIIELNTLVQGDKASDQIINAIHYLQDKVEVIIIARGGGSVEDLWAFNDINLVKAIYDCDTPIVVGIGHESDYTLCNSVADVCANTPTAAIELATPDIGKVNELLQSYKKLLLYYNKQKLDNYTAKLNHYKVALTPKLIKDNLAYKKQQLINNKLNLKQYYINNINLNYIKLDQYHTKLKDTINNIYINKKNILAKQIDTLNILNPLNILANGYSICSKDNNIVCSITQVKDNDILTTNLKDGKIISKVLTIKENDNDEN